MRFYLSLFLLAAFMYSACHSPVSKQADQAQVEFMRATQVDERLSGIDSTVVVYYDDPYGSDSLRYTRFYTQTSLGGTFTKETLPAQFQTVYTKMEKRNACRGEGKIWCYSQGKIIQTLYFNNHCSDNCCYLYFIKDGFFYYTTPLKSFRDALMEAKASAKKPEQMVPED